MPKRKQHSPEVSDLSTKPLNSTVNTPTTVGDSFNKRLAGLCGLAFLLRLLNVLQTFTVPTIVMPLGDAKGYLDWAVQISDGNWYGTETFYQAPLYPYFLAVLIKVFGPSISAIRLVQTLLGAIGVALIGLASRKLFSERVGLGAAFLLAVYPPAIFYDGIIQKAALGAFLTCLFIAVCVQLQTAQRWWWSFTAGATLGLFALTRENALVWAPLVPLWIWLGAKQTAWGRWTLVGCYAAGLALTLLPVAARNASLGGEWSPTTFQAGPNFYIGNSLSANGVYVPLVPGHETPVYERADAQRLAEAEMGHPLSSRAVSQFWMSRAWDEIRQEPLRWVQLMIAKSFMILNRYEVPDVESLYVFREYSLPLKLSWMYHFGLLCPLGIWGMLATIGNWKRYWLYYLLLLSMIAAVVAFFILGRYRNPIAITAIPFAAAGAIDLYERAKRRDWRASKYAVAVLVVSAAICNIQVHDEQSLNASCYMNMGISACQTGNTGTGIQLLERAIAECPDMAEAYMNLGRAFMLNGQPARAVPLFQAALTLDPGLGATHFLLAEALEQCGDTQAAKWQYQQALQFDPGDQRARAKLNALP